MYLSLLLLSISVSLTIYLCEDQATVLINIFFSCLFLRLFICSNAPLSIVKPGGNSAHVSANNVIGWLLQVIAGAIFLSSLPNGLPGRGSLTEIRRQANETLACRIRLQRWIVGREGGYSVCH